MANQHSHSLKDTSSFKRTDGVVKRIDNHMVITFTIMCMVITAIVLVILNPESTFNRGALAMAIIALATLLNYKKTNDEFKVRRISNHSSELSKLQK